MKNQFQNKFDKQKTYFFSNITKSYEWRIDQLTRLENMLQENMAAFKEAMSSDFKTVEFEQNQELIASLGTIAEAKQHLQEWMKPEPAPLPKRMSETGHHAYVYREPYGVTLIIGPFNAPVVLLVDPLLTALSAGNNAIVKPSNSASSVASLFARLIPLYFEEEAVAVVEGGRNEVAQLLELPFDFIFFTGSIQVGKIVMKAAAEHLTPVLLELGGQNAVLVDKTANLKDAARKITWGATAFAGQWCVSPGYVYVESSVANDFVAACKEALNEMYGANAEASPDYSKVISSKDVTRLAGLLEGTNVVYGGQYHVDKRYFAPTIVFPALWEDKMMQEEIFGPILPIIPYDDLSKAIDTIKEKPKGLAAYIFSRDQQVIDLFINSVPFGGGCVNQINLQTFFTSMPFGGVGTSGMGKYFGKYGFDSLSNLKSIVVSGADTVIEDFLPPYSEEKNNDFVSWFMP